MLTKIKSSQQESVPLSTPASVAPSENVYGDAASNLVAGNNLAGAVQHILDMGGGTWDRDTAVKETKRMQTYWMQIRRY
ncbi:hypothetical protein Tco_1307280 [Tanacetum coccineum]